MHIVHQYSLALLAAAISGARVVCADAASKQLYHVTAPSAVFDSAIASFGAELDVWKADPLDDGTIQADIYALESSVAKFKTIQTTASTTTDTTSTTSTVTIKQDTVDRSTLLTQHEKTTASCTSRTDGWLKAVPSATSYLANAFFDCWRKPDEAFAFVDALVQNNPKLISKIAQVAKTIEGRTIPGYKISTGGTNKKSLYTQGGIHAREWIASSTALYTIAGLLDGLKSGNASISSIFDEYDWYFVPLLNLDGIWYTWNKDRYWRKNRRQTGTDTYGVDLNRNYGPKEQWGKSGASKDSDTYPGASMLSEPETSGSWTFLSNLPNLKGVIDLHSYGGLVLRPLGYQKENPPAPWSKKLKTLGSGVAKATMAGSTVKYKNEKTSQLYISHGTIQDGVFCDLNHMAVLAIEVEGDDFVQDESMIRTAGSHVFQGIVQFPKELDAYYS